MLGPLAFLCALLLPALSLKQPTVVVGRLGSWASLSCTASESVSYMHWYRHQEGTAPKRILMLEMSTSSVYRDGGLKTDKVQAKKGRDSKSCYLLLLKLEKSDQGVYYCAVWEYQSTALCEAQVPEQKVSLSQSAPVLDLPWVLGPWGFLGQLTVP
uniref:Ig-like domain-containing protein n=1 Tax=Suricata suricatta TaxID=37032 RepID=A0A673U3P8_SURSU